MRIDSWILGLVVTVVLTLGSGTAYSQQRSPCAGLTGAAHRRCLEAEHRRTTREAAAANARLARLDRRMKTACDMVAVLDKTAEVAQTAGEISRNNRLTYAGMTWTSVRSLMTRLTKERQKCDDARRAVDEARRRQ